MVLNIILPEIEAKPSSTKDAVISMLTLEWPLSLREIFYHIRKKYGYSHSYQAVFKAIKELSEREVLEEKNKKYSINIEWVKKVQSFTDIVETNYYAKEKMHNPSGLMDSKKGEDITVLNFESIFDAEKYLYYFMKYHLFKTNKDIICYSTNAEWRPLFYLRAEYNYYSRLIKRGHKFYFLCSGKSQLEKISSKFYDSLGIKFKFADKFLNDTLVFGDFCINIFIPEEIKQKLRALLDFGNERLFIENLSRILGTRSNIRVIITRDEGLSKEIRKQILEKF